MMMSIVHRSTGASFYLGTLFLAWWLIAAARGPENKDDDGEQAVLNLPGRRVGL
jgi:hypothetical protein